MSFTKLSLNRLCSILFQCKERIEREEKLKKEVHNHNLLNCLSYFRLRKKEKKYPSLFFFFWSLSSLSYPHDKMAEKASNLRPNFLLDDGFNLPIRILYQCVLSCVSCVRSKGRKYKVPACPRTITNPEWVQAGADILCCLYATLMTRK